MPLLTLLTHQLEKEKYSRKFKPVYDREKFRQSIEQYQSQLERKRLGLLFEIQSFEETLQRYKSIVHGANSKEATDDKNFHLIKLITANYGLIKQFNKHIKDAQKLSSRWDCVPFELVKKLYNLIAQHHAQTEKPSLLLLKDLFKQGVTHA